MSDILAMQGRELRSEDIALIHGLLDENPKWARTRLSVELCERWDWRNAQGHHKNMAARTLLLKLERAGLIQLPPRRGGPSEPNKNRNRVPPPVPALNINETGHKENAGKFWTWVFRADLFVLFKFNKSRGSKVLLEVLGADFNGALGCDYFSAYLKYIRDCNITVQFCIAHLIRNIKYLTGLPDAETKAYGQTLLKAVKGMFHIIHGRDNLSAEAVEQAMEQARQTIIKAALDNVPSSLDDKGKEQKNEAFNMAKRFRDNGKAYFEFITTLGIGPTNNLAEQAVRFVVIDRLITQGTRSDKGRGTCERLWTVVGTCALQGRSA